MELLLKGNITLPEYQRHFVWTERDLQRLIKSIEDRQFIQPVTIGLYPESSEVNQNLLLDGQQRLTSILLARLGYFPDKSKFELPIDIPASEDDSALDDTSEEDVAQESKPIQWTIKELQGLGKSIREVQDKLPKDPRYKRLDSSKPDNFWREHFIGFSYVVPESRDEKDVQSYFTRLFRNMNYYGQKLSLSESRKSLYYQNPTFTNYFEGKTEDGRDSLCGLRVAQGINAKPIDFIRYLSILAQKRGLSILKKREGVMTGYASYKSREDFYVDYVAYILGLEQESREDKFDCFTDRNENDIKDVVQNRYPRLIEAISKLKPYIGDRSEIFRSWIDADYWLFGLIYYIVFDGKRLKEDETELRRLSERLQKKISEANSDVYYQKRSNLVGYIRTRLEESIEIYRDHVS